MEDFNPPQEILEETPDPEPAPIVVEPLRQDADLLFLTGEAGTGKTTILHHARKNHPGHYEVTATTGVAAMNADAITINSFIGFGDKGELAYLHKQGRLVPRILGKCKDVKTLVIDEASMLHGSSLDILVDAIRQINEDGRLVYSVAKEDYENFPLRLVLVGDFAQLPPVDKDAKSPPWAFLANCWKDFEVQKLTKIHRQTNPTFMEAIRAARHGNGAMCVRLLQECKVEFTPFLKDGALTLFATNAEVQSWNMEKFLRLLKDNADTQEVFNAMRWGQQRTEWTREIPDAITFCKGTRVRITANDTKHWEYVNGDQGIIESIDEGKIFVKLDRSGRLIEIKRVFRFNDVNNEDVAELRKQGKTVLQRIIYHDDGDQSVKYYIGSVNYMPMKYGWASTVHSVQGLSLDHLQVCPMHKFFGSPNLAYVALSRARNPEGLVIHGIPGQLSRKIVMAKEATPWI